MERVHHQPTNHSNLWFFLTRNQPDKDWVLFSLVVSFFFNFPPENWGRFPIWRAWLIFFKWVGSTTNLPGPQCGNQTLTCTLQDGTARRAGGGSASRTGNGTWPHLRFVALLLRKPWPFHKISHMLANYPLVKSNIAMHNVLFEDAFPVWTMLASIARKCLILAGIPKKIC